MCVEVLLLGGAKPSTFAGFAGVGSGRGSGALIGVDAVTVAVLLKVGTELLVIVDVEALLPMRLYGWEFSAMLEVGRGSEG